MSGDVGYAQEKVWRAVESMACSDRPLRERILDARETFCAVDRDDMPDSGLAAFDELDALFTRARTDASTDVWAASVASLGEEDVQRAANLICEINYRLTEAALGRGDES